MGEKPETSESPAYDQLKRMGLIYNKFMRKEYELALKEIDEDENVKGITKINQPAGTVILTNKRIMLRSFNRYEKANEDIDLKDIDEDTITVRWAIGTGVKFFAKNKEYHILGTKKQIYSKEGVPLIKENLKNLSEIDRKNLIFGDIFATALKKCVIERKQKIFDSLEEGEQKNVILKKLENCIHIDGIPFLSGKEVLLTLYLDRLTISDIDEKNLYKIKIDNIINLKVKTETEISEMERNVLARAIAGGILFGEIGAIIGAISGVSPRQVKKHHHFLIIDYLSKEGNKKSLIFFYKHRKQILENFKKAIIKEIKKHRPEHKEIEL